MILGGLSAAYVRQTYLRGIDLGTAWDTPSATGAIENLLETRIAVAQGQLGIQFCHQRVRTVPDVGLQLGRDYEIVGYPIPYSAPAPEDTLYSLLLDYAPPFAITRIRLFEGYDLSLQPVYETVPLDGVTVSRVDDHLLVPVSAVVHGPLAQAWLVDYTIGLGQLPLEIAEWVTLGVAMQVLATAGSGKDISGGLASESLTMDGIEETLTHRRGAEGPYDATIRTLQTRLEMIDLIRMRMRYQGQVL